MSITILQISDCHLGAEAGETLLGVDTDESLVAVLKLADTLYPQADLLAFTGDISNTGCGAAYPRLQAMVASETGFTVPSLWLPGNHDDNTLMAEAVGAGFLGSVGLGAWQISCLDSSIPRAVPGLITESELQRSSQILADHPQQHHLFFLHHHLQAIGCQWLDPQVISNAPEVLSTWAQYPQLKAVCHGHVHQQQQQDFAHFHIFASPSTCIQFAPNSDDFALADDMPGFRAFILHDDGEYESHVHRISQRDLRLDVKAAGY